MRTVAHPEYETLDVYVAQSIADSPVPGSFFVTAYTVPLSDVAAKAYGSGSITPTLRINKSKYNQTHCIYRRESAKCFSPKVNSSIAATQTGWGPGAWLSLCNVDKNGQGNLGYGSLLGVPYQVIWVPTTDGKEPWDLEPPEDKDLPVEKKTPSTPDFDARIPDIDIDLPDVDVYVPGDDDGGGGGEPQPEPKKAGFPWWLGALLGLAAVGGMIRFALVGKKRGKKKGKKKGR